jgi:hypothetical protein
MALLTMELALIIGGGIIVGSIITAAVIAQLYPLRVIEHSDESHESQRYEFAAAATTTAADIETSLRHLPPRLSLHSLTAMPDRSRARA